MEMIPVTSSQIAAIGHDGDILTVRFKNGALWQYADVTAEAFGKLQGAESVGKFFNANIKPHHKATRIK